MCESLTEEFERRVGGLESLTVVNVLGLLVEVGEGGDGQTRESGSRSMFGLLMEVVELGKTKGGRDLVGGFLQMLRTGIEEIHAEDVGRGGNDLRQFTANMWLIETLGFLQEQDGAAEMGLVAGVTAPERGQLLRVGGNDGFGTERISAGELLAA